MTITQMTITQMTITHRNTPSTALAAHPVQNDLSTEGTEIRNAILGNPLQGGEKCREGTSTREKDTAFIQSTLLDPHPQRRKEILQKHPEVGGTCSSARKKGIQ